LDYEGDLVETTGCDAGQLGGTFGGRPSHGKGVQQSVIQRGAGAVGEILRENPVTLVQFVSQRLRKLYANAVENRSTGDQ
jgi:hypothetical protein